MAGGAALFLGSWLQHPLQIAAVCPSSESLAAVLGRLANVDRPGTVLELGAGTGSLTPGLLGPGGRFLQITNAFSSPLRHHELGIVGQEAARIWRNVPPAQIWAYGESGEAAQEAP